jgi:glycosyltransferase involved in cell wall biosynthesis
LMKMSEIKFWLRSSAKHDSLHIQTKKVVDIMCKHGISSRLIFADQLSFFSKIRVLLFSKNVVGVFGSFDLWLLLLINSKRLSLVYHNITPSKFFLKNEPLVAFRSWLGRLQLRFFRREIAVIAVSPFNANELKSLRYQNIEYCPCVVDTNVVVGSQHNTYSKTCSPTVMFTGRIVENKNCIELLKQMQRIASTIPSGLDLVIVGGKGKDRSYCQQFSRVLAECTHDGTLTVEWFADGLSSDDLQKKLASSWVYVSMSLHEGFGLPVCEAILAGTPALYLECGGTESVLDSIGMVPLCHASDFWRRTLCLIESSDLRMELLAKQSKVVERYTSESLSELVCKIYAKFDR